MRCPIIPFKTNKAQLFGLPINHNHFSFRIMVTWFSMIFFSFPHSWFAFFNSHRGDDQYWKLVLQKWPLFIQVKTS